MLCGTLGRLVETRRNVGRQGLGTLDAGHRSVDVILAVDQVANIGGLRLALAARNEVAGGLFQTLNIAAVNSLRVRLFRQRLIPGVAQLSFAAEMLRFAGKPAGFVARLLGGS